MSMGRLWAQSDGAQRDCGNIPGSAPHRPERRGMMAGVVTLFDEGFARDPWDALRELRADGGVHRVRTPDGPPAWLVTRYRDVRAGLGDERLSTNLVHARGQDYRGFAVPAPLDVFQSSEADVLGRLRGAVAGELQPRRLRQWTEEATQAITTGWDALDGAAAFDFVERVAVPIPALVLGELLGLPEGERELLAEWANTTLRAGAAPRARDTIGMMGRILEGAKTFGQQEPGETMLGRLSDGRLSDGELTGLLFYLLFVWYEVVVDLVSGAVLELSARPEQRDALLAMPDRRSAVDELLRYLSPQVLAGPRFAVCDMEIGGAKIAAGETVLLCLAAANHDDEIFERAAELEVRRAHNPHLALGHGMHACVGTGLVHPIAAAVLEQALRRWPDLRVTAGNDTLTWRSGFRHRGPLTLPVLVT
ncbi:cytochrome P450 [Nocardia huaxiensis]|uniref:cytochrome P450 n=1 Tax=Nocardia huaxiensis TaxID=2755382 RepID=UPI001E569D6E|nr:cytochrome P450 [Nocardia huaxiensis]UFS96200.1 cytochrome P450 [Nocardia huaxiensis]